MLSCNMKAYVPVNKPYYGPTLPLLYHILEASLRHIWPTAKLMHDKAFIGPLVSTFKLFAVFSFTTLHKHIS